MEACTRYKTPCMARLLVLILVVLWHLHRQMTLLLSLLVGTVLLTLQCLAMLGLRQLPFRGANTDLWGSRDLGV